MNLRQGYWSFKLSFSRQYLTFVLNCGMIHFGFISNIRLYENVENKQMFYRIALYLLFDKRIILNGKVFKFICIRFLENLQGNLAKSVS